MTGRVTFNEPDNWLGPRMLLGAVDEIVLNNAYVHIETLGDGVAYLRLSTENREIEGTIGARPTTRRQRRELLTHSQDRLRDHLRSLIPWPPRRTLWSVPVWRRPAAAVQAWREASRYAHAVLFIDIESDHEVTIGRPV